MGTLIALPAGSYNWYDTDVSGVPIAGPTSVTVAALTAGTVSPASPTVGDTLSVTGSNAPPGAAFLWQYSSDSGVTWGSAGGSNTGATYSTTAQPTGQYRRRITLVNSAEVFSAAVTLGAAAGFSDNFNRTDGAMGSNWATFADFGGPNPAWQVNTNEARFTGSTATGTLAIRTVTSISGAAFAEVTFAGVTGTPTYGVMLADTGTGRGYLFIYNVGANSRELYRFTTGGSFTGLGTNTNGAFSANDVIRIERTIVDASTVRVRVLLNGTQIRSEDDISGNRITGDVFGGIYGEVGNTAHVIRLDTFSQGTV